MRVDQPMYEPGRPVVVTKAFKTEGIELNAGDPFDPTGCDPDRIEKMFRTRFLAHTNVRPSRAQAKQIKRLADARKASMKHAPPKRATSAKTRPTKGKKAVALTVGKGGKPVQVEYKPKKKIQKATFENRYGGGDEDDDEDRDDN